jgi:Zn-dependent protease
LRIPELPGIIISWLTISISFSISYLFNTPSLFEYVFFLAAATAGVGFVLHELAHRTVARNYGYSATYEVWWWGVIVCLLMAVLTQGALIFAALGAVYISPKASNRYLDEKGFNRAYGMISLAGPAMNLLLAIAFYALSSQGGILSDFGAWGMQINLWLAAFNLIPVPPFDGSKIFHWSKLVWIALAAPAWLLVLFSL